MYAGSRQNARFPEALVLALPSRRVAGNAIYFSVERFLPVRAQHQIYQIDWGLAVDFWMCLVCYGLVRLIR
jgi:hypothetical protein